MLFVALVGDVEVPGECSIALLEPLVNGWVLGGVASCKSCAVSPEAPPVRRLFTVLSPTCRVLQRSAKTVFFVIDWSAWRALCLSLSLNHMEILKASWWVICVLDLPSSAGGHGPAFKCMPGHAQYRFSLLYNFLAGKAILIFENLVITSIVWLQWL